MEESVSGEVCLDPGPASTSILVLRSILGRRRRDYTGYTCIILLNYSPQDSTSIWLDRCVQSEPDSCSSPSRARTGSDINSTTHTRPECQERDGYQDQDQDFESWCSERELLARGITWLPRGIAPWDNSLGLASWRQCLFHSLSGFQLCIHLGEVEESPHKYVSDGIVFA